MTQRYIRELWLVQRLTRDDSDRRGFDGVFAGQYMGSAEFEWGALPESLARIRGGRRVGLSTIELDGRTVYLYGSKKGREAIAAVMPEWVLEGCLGKEWSYFGEHLLGGNVERWQQVDAWWALNADVLFTLDPQVATMFEDAVTR